jgi:hypothetical protein
MVVGERPGVAISFELWRPTSSSMSFACSQCIGTRLLISHHRQRGSFQTQERSQSRSEVDRGFGGPTSPLGYDDNGG